MSNFYTRTGDDGYTGLLGKERVPKYDQRTEAIGTLDESSAALGVARAASKSPATHALLLATQQDIYKIMAEVAATPENAARFRGITAERVQWLETQIDDLSAKVPIPNEFILPGDSQAGAALALSRTIVRRAERRVAYLFHQQLVENPNLLIYLNRLSSLCFILELHENSIAGKDTPTLAKSAT